MNLTLSFPGRRSEAEVNPESISVRRAGKEDDRQTNELKPFVAIQRVRIPPGKGAARQPEASLAGAAATPRLKRTVSEC